MIVDTWKCCLCHEESQHIGTVPDGELHVCDACNVYASKTMHWCPECEKEVAAPFRHFGNWEEEGADIVCAECGYKFRERK